MPHRSIHHENRVEFVVSVAEATVNQHYQEPHHHGNARNNPASAHQ